ncbi:hypothetical protein OH77DRAFT_1100943 [Trametes cingulata]|nr:hypothetical protein OH77DRAFT_1100943 [Trametes cingulata]
MVRCASRSTQRLNRSLLRHPRTEMTVCSRHPPQLRARYNDAREGQRAAQASEEGRKEESRSARDIRMRTAHIIRSASLLRCRRGIRSSWRATARGRRLVLAIRTCGNSSRARVNWAQRSRGCNWAWMGPGAHSDRGRAQLSRTTNLSPERGDVACDRVECRRSARPGVILHCSLRRRISVVLGLGADIHVRGSARTSRFCSSSRRPPRDIMDVGRAAARSASLGRGAEASDARGC